MTNPIYIVYKHTCTITGKSYIGQTSKSIIDRWNEHNYKSNLLNHFQNAINKHGKDNFTHEILFETTDQNIINKKEIEYIAKFDTYHNGYNMTIGGSGLGQGETHVWYGKNHTSETKFKMSKSSSGKNSPYFKGWYHTPKGQFETLKEASIQNKIGIWSVSNWCNNPDKIINKNNIAGSKYLQYLPESPEGKTFRELGFWFIPYTV